jgi:hypothetical protein
MVDTNVHEPLTFTVGDDAWISINCTDAADHALDLTTSSVEWQLKDADGTIAVQLTKAEGDIAVDAGVCAIWLHAATTALLAAGFYQDRLRITSEEGFITTLSSGPIQFRVLP